MSTEIEPSRKKEEWEIIEDYDEKQIVEELKGHILQEYFYSFDQGGRKVVGLSYAGVKHIARVMATNGMPLSVVETKITETPDTYRAEITVRNQATKENRLGVAEEDRFTSWKDKSGNPVRDKFALSKVVSKATRNGLRAHIDEESVKAGYKEWEASQTKTIVPKATL